MAPSGLNESGPANGPSPVDVVGRTVCYHGGSTVPAHRQYDYLRREPETGEG
jgi:hypothetical protein